MFKFLVALLALSYALAIPAQSDTVLITGSNQGIGLEFAKEYAARGWTVIATHRRKTPPETLVALAKTYPKLRVERMDVTDHREIDALAQKLKGIPIDVLINNAAITRTAPLNDPKGNANQMFGTLDYKLFDTFMHTNVAGPLHVVEAFIKNVEASRQKKIVAMSSAAGTVSVLPAAADHYWYRISKAALNSAMRLITVQFRKKNVIVVMFHPGGVQVESFGNLKIPGFVAPRVAVSKMMKTIDGLTIKDSGRFLTADGHDMPW